MIFEHDTNSARVFQHKARGQDALSLRSDLAVLVTDTLRMIRVGADGYARADTILAFRIARELERRENVASKREKIKQLFERARTRQCPPLLPAPRYDEIYAEAMAVMEAEG